MALVAHAAGDVALGCTGDEQIFAAEILARLGAEGPCPGQGDGKPASPADGDSTDSTGSEDAEALDLELDLGEDSDEDEVLDGDDAHEAAESKKSVAPAWLADSVRHLALPPGAVPVRPAPFGGDALEVDEEGAHAFGAFGAVGPAAAAGGVDGDGDGCVAMSDGDSLESFDGFDDGLDYGMCGGAASSSGSPWPLAPRKGSDLAYCSPEQTLIIFDWDDTLCASTACMEANGHPNAAPVQDEVVARGLQDLARASKALIERAGELAARVAIVTNGGERWVQASCAAWLPELLPSLDNVEVVSARARWEPCGVSSPTGWKAKEFENVIDRFYSRYENQSWKNVVVVGDAVYEHDAMRRVLDAASAEVAAHCRPKSVRFLTKPSVSELIYEIASLRDELQAVVYHDGELDVTVSVEDLYCTV